LRGHSQPDREHHHEDGSHRSRRVGPTPIRNRNYGQRRATRTPPPHASKVPRGMELLDQTTTLKLVKVISSPCLRVEAMGVQVAIQAHGGDPSPFDVEGLVWHCLQHVLCLADPLGADDYK